MKRFIFLDCMRGLAVLLVMLTHFSEGKVHSIDAISNNYIQIGQMGVSIFFLISGYIIPRSIASAKSIKEFWVHRIFRLFPIYWISIFLAGLFSHLNLMHLPSGITTSAVLLNFSMLQGFLGVQNVIGVFWSLKFELAFYFLMTIISSLRLMRFSSQISFLYSLGISFIAILMYFFQGKYFAYGLFHIQLMLIGWAIGEKQSTAPDGSFQTSLAIAAGVLVTILTAFTSFYGRNDSAAGGTLSFIPMVCAWLLSLTTFLLAVALRDSPLWPSWLSWIGRISYSAYLLHVLVLFVLTPVVRDWGIFALPVLFSTSLFLAWGGYRFVEQPSIAAGKRLADYWFATKASARMGATK